MLRSPMPRDAPSLAARLPAATPSNVAAKRVATCGKFCPWVKTTDVGEGCVFEHVNQLIECCG